jgi:gamma-glutamyl-gamma-aminobutyrate hydrolase PuuD
MLLLVDLCHAKKQYCFTYLEDVIKNLNVPYIVVRQIKDIQDIQCMQDIQGIQKKKTSAIILSGSPIRLTNTNTRNKKELDLINLAIHVHLSNPGVPILGICFGFQLLNVLYGGSVKPFGRLVCERLTDGLEYCFNDYVDKQAPGFQVRKRVIVDGRSIICHTFDPKRKITAYLFHSEATDNDKRRFIGRWIGRVLPTVL